jgi:hypothetical protein
LAAALDDFDASIIINPLVYDEAKHRQTLEESLESIISGAALLADSRYIWVAHFRVHKFLEFWPVWQFLAFLVIFWGKLRNMLEESLESIISGAALLADSRYI